MFLRDPFARFIYKKQMKGIIDRFRSENRFPCISVGKLTSNCNRHNYYKVNDVFEGKERDYSSEDIIRMTMGQILHDSFELSPKAEWHLVYNDVYGHIDEYFPEAKILIEKKTTMDKIGDWKQTKAKSYDKFKYMPNEFWENQLRYYYLLVSKGKEVDTGNPANPNNEKLVKRIYVLYYCGTDIESFFDPYIVPVPIEGDKWDLSYIEREMMSKKEEIENCMKGDIVPPRNVAPFRCQYCDYKTRCYGDDVEEGEDITPEIEQALGKLSSEAKLMELRG